MVTPAYLLDVLKETHGAVKVDAYTSAAWVRRLSGEQQFAESNSRVLSWVPADQLSVLYEEHDCLLSIGELPGRQLSSKIFSYMATGKPIVHIYHADDDVNLPYFKNYPLSLTLRDDGALLEENVKRLCLFLLWARGKKSVYSTVHEVMYECTPEAVCAHLIQCAMRGAEMN